MILKDILPSPTLRELVRKHQIIRFMFGAGDIVPCKVYSPRPEHCLVFYLRDLQYIGYPNNSTLQTHPKCTLNGQHTVVTSRYVACDFWALQIVLQPGVLYKLTGIPAYELMNTFIDAEAVWGKDIRTTHEEMCNQETIEAVIKIAEDFLLKINPKTPQNSSRIDKIGQLMLGQPSIASVDKLAEEACLSPRQFNRKFIERMGISPKVFARIVRFERAFRLKNANPHWDWLSIALACGYYDYQHLVKDYKEFTHLTPTAFYEVDTQAPERFFGQKEV